HGRAVDRGAGDAIRREPAGAPGRRPRLGSGRRAMTRVSRAATAVAACALASTLAVGTSAQPPPVVIGSKPFGESYLLAELCAQLLEAHDVAVTRQFGLGGTEILFAAMRAGRVDLYPEYSGAGLRVLLKVHGARTPAEVFDTSSRTCSADFDVRWRPPRCL